MISHESNQAALSRQPIRQMSFYGSGGTLFGIYVINLLLTVLTLGVYYFWGKVKVRNYLLSQIEFEGDRFAYHGTGAELFIGWLKVAFFIGLLVAVATVVRLVWENPVAESIITILLYLIFLALTPIAIVGSRRYRLSRTSWRGIRFSFRGRAKDFIKVYVPGLLLTAVSLGLYYPYFQNNIRKFLVGGSYFGTTRFNFDGKGSDLFPSFILALVLSALTLGVYWFWFVAERQRYYWSHTSFATARFRSTATGRRLLGLMAGNLFLLISTLGIAWPWVMVRSAKFALSNLVVEGPLDLAAIYQEAQAVSATGEGLSDILDTGFLDIDLGL